MITLTVRADNEISGEYSGATDVDLAFRVAAACAKQRREVTVFDGEHYLDKSGGKHGEPYLWPMPGPVGRPALPGKVLHVRIPDADYDALLDIGAGDVAQGISRALACVSHRKA